MSIVSGPKIIDDGLVLHLDASNQKSYPGSGIIWFDVSNNNNNASIINGTAFNNENINQSFFNFDGINDYIEVPAISNLFPTYNNSITYEVWSYTPTGAQWHSNEAGNASGTNIISRGTYSSFNGLGRSSTNNRVVAWYRSSSGTSSVTGTIGRDRWYHLVSIWDGSGSRLYIDGVLIGINNRSMTSNPSTINISIGRQRPLGGNVGGWYEGRLNGIKIYNRALSTNEVKQNFEAQRGRYGI
jgi:hypothetical protein